MRLLIGGNNIIAVLFLLVLFSLMLTRGIIAYEGEDNSGRNELKAENPALYYILSFFNPAPLNNTIGFVLTILFAVGTLFAFAGFEGTTKVVLVFISLYCWGRIITFFLGASLVGQGVLSP